MAEEFDVVIIGGGAAGENVAGRVSAGGADGGRRGVGACGRRVLVLGVHAQQGAAAAGGGAGGGAARAFATARESRGGIDVERALHARNAFASNWNDEGQVQWRRR